jgi:hypothetical protein
MVVMTLLLITLVYKATKFYVPQKHNSYRNSVCCGFKKFKKCLFLYKKQQAPYISIWITRILRLLSAKCRICTENFTAVLFATPA